MTDQDKELLLKDLSARVPYGVKIEGYKLPCIILNSDWLHFMYTHQEFALRRPYLRPISSMTEEEKKYLSERYVWKINGSWIEIKYHSDGYWDNDIYCPTEEYIWLFDWLNANHFDYRGLIEKGLALEAPEGMYNI